MRALLALIWVANDLSTMTTVCGLGSLANAGVDRLLISIVNEIHIYNH